MTGNHHELPTVSSTLAARYVAVLIWCKSCAAIRARRTSRASTPAAVTYRS